MDRHEAHGKLETLARFGIATKGLVYLVVGVLAVWAAVGTGGAVTGSEGALRAIAGQPFGQVLLWVVAIGLVGYATWKGAQAVTDADHEGTDAKGMAKRLGYGVSAIVHLGLAAAAARLAVGAAGGGGRGARGWTAELMSQPFGVWLVGIVGVVVIGVGLYQLVKAYRVEFLTRLHLEQMSANETEWARRLGQVGYAARAVVFAIIGGFLVSAAANTDPSRARGLGGALRAVQDQPWGPWLLGLVALGLVAFALFSFVQARYRHVEV